jgi:hypothetical protein
VAAKELQTIGRRERVSFPELGLKNVEAKIDTGAYTAALHCSKIWTEEVENIPTLFFKLLDESHPNYNQKVFHFSVFGKRKIKNSSGVFESRFTIKTAIRIGRKKIQASISLTDRGGMKYPVLIGRKLLNKRFVVDVSKLNLLEKKAS